MWFPPSRSVRTRLRAALIGVALVSTWAATAGCQGDLRPVYRLVDGGAGICVEVTHSSNRVPLDVVILLEASRGMADRTASGRQKWDVASDAVNGMLSAPQAEGLRVAMQLYPQSARCQSDLDCEPMETCTERSVCVSDTATPVEQTACSATAPCAAGSHCTPVGRCPLTLGPCTGLGLLCEGRLTDNVCTAQPKACVWQGRASPDCEWTDYDQPVVALRQLPGGLDLLQHALESPVLDEHPGSPLRAALEGTLYQEAQELKADPQRRGALVLVTDGENASCDATAAAVLSPVARAFAQNAISTFVIPVFTPEEAAGAARTNAEAIAVAGGTQASLPVEGSQPLADRVHAALDALRGPALPCALELPTSDGGPVDYAALALTFTSGGTTDTIPYVERADHCDPAGGWYYDQPPASATPARALVCDATCRRLVGQTGPADLRLGCPAP